MRKCPCGAVLQEQVSLFGCCDDSGQGVNVGAKLVDFVFHAHEQIAGDEHGETIIGSRRQHLI